MGQLSGRSKACEIAGADRRRKSLSYATQIRTRPAGTLMHSSWGFVGFELLFFFGTNWLQVSLMRRVASEVGFGSSSVVWCGMVWYGVVVRK